jgi:photosystem II stability/assembly factor-like uncharacterized protein
MLAATSDGVYRSGNGGTSWGRTFSQPVDALTVDPNNAHVVYASGRGGVYKSADYGEQGMGTSWRQISGDAPTGDNPVFAVDPREVPARLYLMNRHNFYTKRAGAPEWTRLSHAVRERGFSEVDPIRGTPQWIRVDRHVPGRLFRAVEVQQWRFSGALIDVSDDGGKTWSPIVRALKPLADWSVGAAKSEEMPRTELRRMFEMRQRFSIHDLRVDPRDPVTWYGRLTDGVAVTRDAGRNWTVGAEGLDIPRVNAIWTPRHADLVVVGTPAGMYVSADHGTSWQDTSLILNGNGAIRSEIGGAGYLTAYWMGRYHNFITDADAQAAWWKE